MLILGLVDDVELNVVCLFRTGSAAAVVVGCCRRCVVRSDSFDSSGETQ
jgi:hypothetical protein